MCTTSLWCVESCKYEDIRHTSFQLHPCGGLPTERCFRLVIVLFSFSCLVQVGKPCGTTMLQHKATADRALPPLSKHIQRLACQGFCTRVIGGYSCFCFLIVLQGIEHASRKTDMRILISYMGVVYTLSLAYRFMSCFALMFVSSSGITLASRCATPVRSWGGCSSQSQSRSVHVVRWS